MREENYFEKKLETSKETLIIAERKVEHLDIQILKLKERFDHDKKVYDDQVTHMQNIISDMKKRIPELEKKLKAGYTTIDLVTGKAYKSFKERHIGQLREKVEWAEMNRKLLEENHKKKEILKKRRREKLQPVEIQIVEAEEIRESLQGKDEVKEAYEKQLESLQKKKDEYQKQLDELEQKKKIPIKKPEPEVTTEDQLEIVKEVKEIVNNKIEELEPGKVQCPECKEWYTKGGAFAAHYKSHFPNGNTKE